MTEKVCSLTTPDSEEEIELPLYEGSLGPMGLDISQLIIKRVYLLMTPDMFPPAVAIVKSHLLMAKKAFFYIADILLNNLQSTRTFLKLPIFC